MNVAIHDYLARPEKASYIAKAITLFAFRLGPVERMHSDKKKNITQSDMEKLNKFMHDRLTFVFRLLFMGRWVELGLLYEMFEGRAQNWDEPDIGRIERIMQNVFIQDYTTRGVGIDD